MNNETAIKNLNAMKMNYDQRDKKSIPIQTIDMAIEALEKQIPKEDYGNTWVPKLYATYYYPDFEHPESVWRTLWTDTWTDNRIKNTVGIYKTKQQALDKAIKLGWLEEELK